MSKRTYLILILLLVVVDIVAGFWYLAARIESSGDSRDLFDTRGDSTQVLDADTISELNVPDVFRMFARDTAFVSNYPAEKGGYRFTSVKHIKLRWPESVNGSDSLDALERALLGKMFSTSATSLSRAVAEELGKPTFNTSLSTGYHTVSKAPAVQATYSNVSTLLVFPVITSMRLLVMQVERRSYNGIETTLAKSYVHYDRGMQRVLTRAEVFAADTDAKLLSAINAKIDILNRDKHLNLSHASQLPSEFMARRKGILFFFDKGILAGVKEDEVEVFVDYDDLRPLFTPLFQRLVADNGGYWDYKPITID